MHSRRQKPSSVRIWLWAIRPRTLPLSAAAIFLGYGLAGLQGKADQTVFLLALLTAVLLQVLSNLANDYGDAVAGADTDERTGPLRMVVSGLTSPDSMFRAVLLAAALALCSGLALVLTAAWGEWAKLFFFLGLGAASIAAAIAYTVGRHPYGYLGLGDLMAGIFFGPAPVWGTLILCGGELTFPALFPGIAAGLCSAMVLNANNMRDIETDAKAGKKTVAVRLGLKKAGCYHAVLTLLTLLCWCIFLLTLRPACLPALLFALPLLRVGYLTSRHNNDTACLYRRLKNTVLSTALLHTCMATLCLALGP